MVSRTRAGRAKASEAPAADVRLAKLTELLRSTALEIAGPGASFEDVEAISCALRNKLVAEVLQEQRERLAGEEPVNRPSPRKRRSLRKRG